ncbi:MAG: hypothetical protein NWE95_05715 [Candidatus Bathyarchaeota archaeon]|nr:hypothetical protein [Candidatus Bathyarchaeota archaeon]
MKKTLPVAISILLLCSALIGTATAGNAAYTIIEAYQTSAVTLDGVRGTTEWNDAWIEYLGGPTNKFGYKMDSNTGAYLMSWFIEFVDATNDAGDKWQICIDGSNNGGTTIDSDNDHKIEITGHTTLKVYKGSASGWAEMATTGVTWKDNATTGHYLVEIQANKGELGTWGQNMPPHGLRVAMYDASTQTWVVWPPTSTETNPNSWGVIGGPEATIPESLNFGVVALLSTAVIAGAFVLSKRTKSTNLAFLTHK